MFHADSPSSYKKKFRLLGVFIVVCILLEIILYANRARLEERRYSIQDGILYQFSLQNRKLSAQNNDPNVTIPNINMLVGSISIQCKNSVPGAIGQVFYRNGSESFNEMNSITYDAASRDITLTLPITQYVSSLRLDLTDSPGDTVICQDLVLNRPISFRLNRLRLMVYIGLFLVIALYLFRDVKPIDLVRQKISSDLDQPFLALLYYASPLIFVWSVYLLAFWPGLLSFDSINQLEQVISFQFNDWHPVFHTLTYWLITRLWFSPAAIALAQILVMSLVLSWGLVEQRRIGAATWLSWSVVAIFMIAPSMGLMAIVLWKDVLFSVSVVALTILVFKIIFSSGKWIDQPRAWIYLGAVAVLVALYRHNGVIVAFGTLLCLLIAYLSQWKKYSLALMLAFVLWVCIRGPLYNLLNVDKTSPMASNQGAGMSFLHLVARYTNTTTPFTPEERSLLLEIHPDFPLPYYCYMDVDLLNEMNWQGLKDRTSDLVILSLNLVRRNPAIFFEHLACNSSFMYQIIRPMGSVYEVVPTEIISNQMGISTDSKLPSAKRALEVWIGLSQNLFDWIFWRAPIWEYLFVVGMIMYWARYRNWRIALLAVPILLNTLPLAFFTLGQAFRYIFPSFLVSLLMGGFLVTISYKKESLIIPKIASMLNLHKRFLKR